MIVWTFGEPDSIRDRTWISPPRDGEPWWVMNIAAEDAPRLEQAILDTGQKVEVAGGPMPENEWFPHYRPDQFGQDMRGVRAWQADLSAM